MERSVLITGATGQVGGAAIQTLARQGRRLTALVRQGRQLSGCTVISDWLVSDEAAAALRQAEAIVHLAGTLNPPDHDYERANVLPAQRVAGAVTRGRARKVVFLSYVGASEESPNRYLSTKARAERLLRETGIPTTIFRCTHIIGPPINPGPTAASLLASGGRSVTVLGNGKQRVAPIYLGDVAAAVIAALDSDHTGTFDLQGPDDMSIDELVKLLNSPAGVSIRHVPTALSRLLRFVGPKLPAALIGAMVSDCRSRGEHPAASPAFGLVPTPISRVWSAAGSRGG
jgi:NADH dehydrogenase